MTKNPFMGRVITPDDPGYEQARHQWNTRYNERPRRIVYCQSAQEASAALLHTLDQGTPFRVRSGGHSVEAFSRVDGGVVIDVTDLNTISVSRDRTVAVIGSGARLGDVYTKLWQMGITIPAGTCPQVGISGLAVGGGVGMLSRSRGLLIDNVLEIELVDAKGRILTVNAHNHPDLFWACRGGGGGNFGIVTSLTVRTAPISEATVFTVTWDWTDFAAAFDAWQRWVPDADERISSFFHVLPGPRMLLAFGQFIGTEEELRTLLEPLTSTGHPTQILVQTMPYTQAVETIAAFEGPPPGTVVGPLKVKGTMSFVARPFDDQTLQVLEELSAKAPSGPATVIFMYSLGGAVRRVAPDATAFVHRNARLGVGSQAIWVNPEDEQEGVAWVESILGVVQPYVTGVYVNNPDRSLENWQWAYYGDNFPRLVEVKRRYDPNNVFNHPQSIPVSLRPKY